MSNNNKFLIDLTEKELFSGLYNTIWLNDYTLSDESDELSEKLSERYNRKISIDFSISFKEYLEKIADVYINCFENEIPNSKWVLERVSSPREYNFDTDHIILKWTNTPKNAEDIFNQYLKDIGNDYVDFENFTIYDFYCGYEIIHELAQIHDWDDDQNIITYDEQNQPIMQKYEVTNND